MRRLLWLSGGFGAVCALAVWVRPSFLWLCFVPLAVILSRLLWRAVPAKSWGTGVVWCAAGIAAGLLWCTGFTYTVLMPAEAMAAEKTTVSCTALSAPATLSYGQSVTVRVKPEGGLPVKGTLYLYLEKEADVQIGDRLTVKCSCEAVSKRYAEGRFLALTCNETPTVTGREPAWRHLPALGQEWVTQQLSALYSGDALALLEALLTGERGLLYEEEAFYGWMQSSGTAHALAVSGMHISVLCTLLHRLLGRRKPALGITAAAACCFAAMTGFSHSAVRAAIMEGALLLGEILDKENDSLNSMGLALLALLGVNPCSIASAGLELSFTAVFGIVWLSPMLYERLQTLLHAERRDAAGKLLRGILSACSVSFSAMLFTAPVLAMRFGSVPITALAANLVILPLIEALFSIGIFTIPVSLLWQWGGGVLVSVCEMLVKALRWLAEGLGTLPGGTVYTGHWYMMALVWYTFVAVVLIAATGCELGRLGRQLCICTITLCAGIFLVEGAGLGRSLAVSVLDVGQGQSVAVLSRGCGALIDCGGGASSDPGTTAADTLRAEGIRRLDALILTHYHEDHTGGVETLLRQLPVTAVYMPMPTEEDLEKAISISVLAQMAGGAVIYVSEETAVSVGGAVVTLYPPEAGDTANERCMAAVISRGDFDAVITGDMTQKAEDALADRLRIHGDAELLVAGHHGAKDACGPGLLEVLQPESTVISVGENSYGHPAQETLERLDRIGTNVYRTDEDGTVTVELREAWKKSNIRRWMRFGTT